MVFAGLSQNDSSQKYMPTDLVIIANTLGARFHQVSCPELGMYHPSRVVYEDISASSAISARDFGCGYVAPDPSWLNFLCVLSGLAALHEDLETPIAIALLDQMFEVISRIEMTF
jgi:hypothetical protein